MLWLPVLFACLNSGQCAFIYDNAELTEQQCASTLKEMVLDAKKSSAIATIKGTCIPVSGKQI